MRTPRPEVKWRPLYKLTPGEAVASEIVEISRGRMADWIETYHLRLEAELRKALTDGRNLAVSPLTGDATSGLRYEFVQCDGLCPRPGWTTYQCSLFYPEIGTKDK